MKLTKLLCAAVLALATVATAQPKKLVVWHAYRGQEKAAFEKVVAEFNKANAGKLEATTLWGDTRRSFGSALRRGPDAPI